MRERATRTHRWQVAARCVAAAAGGFALASAAAVALAWLIVRAGWAPQASATATATLLSFALWCGVVMWAFHTPSVMRLGGYLAAPSLLLGAVACWLAAGA